MTRSPVVVTPLDLRLLDALTRERTLVAACRRLGIGRDTGVYRLRRLSAAVGRPVVSSRRGGRAPGATRLTPAGIRLLARGGDAIELERGSPRTSDVEPNRWTGTYTAHPVPSLVIPGGPTVVVGFDADEGERVSVELDPEAVLLARASFPSSARNRWNGRVEAIVDHGPGTGTSRRLVQLRVGSLLLRAAVTVDAVRQLDLVRGRPVVLFVKATALKRRGAPSGPPRIRPA